LSRLKSSVVIAKLLDSEGFNDHVQNMVEKYWLNTIKASGRKKHRRLERNIAEMCKKFDDGEKLILGKFISMHKAMSFQTGLRIGLTAFACKHDKAYCVEDSGRGDADAIGAENSGTTADDAGNSRVLRSAMESLKQESAQGQAPQVAERKDAEAAKANGQTQVTA
jgi:hypothetical protein